MLAHPDELKSVFIPGGYVTAQIDVKTQLLPTLPESAVVGFGGKFYVYMLESKGGQPAAYQFRQVEVQPGVRENGFVAVSLPAAINPAKTPEVINGGYSLLSKLNNVAVLMYMSTTRPINGGYSLLSKLNNSEEEE